VLCRRSTKVIALVREGMTDTVSGGNFLKRYMLKRRLTVLGDPDRRIGMLYGLPDDEIKGAFIIDPKGILRARLCSPVDNDRNFHEILTVLDALQAADRQKAGKPETVSWRKRLKTAIRPKPAEQT
jgi:peroxiredoxin (alkyl hydroperoxide reductase subunit C)